MSLYFGGEEIAIDDVDQIGFDTQYEEKTLAKIEKESRGYDVTFDDGWSMGWPFKDGIDPKVGDTIRCYGKGIGYTVRGIAVNGKVLYYESEEEHAAKMKYEYAKKERNDAVRNWMRRHSKAERIRDLPPKLRERMEYFEKDRPGFLLTSDSDYELFVYEEACVIAEALKTVEAINAWKELPYEQQKAEVPISDGHSGNTFGAACSFAKWLVEDNE